MNELNINAKNKADSFISNAEKAAEAINSSTTLGIVVISLLSLAIATLISRSILTQLASLTNKMSEITSTGELTQMKITGASELTRLAHHFNSLIVTLRDQLWLRGGVGDLGSELSGDLDLEAISNRAISFLARNIEACAGALYTYNHPYGTCELSASYALVEHKYLAGTVKLGEGIIGQVASDRTPVHLTEISADDAMAQSGTLAQPPKAIYAVPLTFNGKLYGVLELASFKPFTQIKQQFIDETASLIATNLFTSEQNQKVRELLRQTQLAHEQLQIKSDEINRANEEMAATNEELEAQSAELRASSEELKAQTNELQEQHLLLEKADQLKSEFLSNMSHELRTPLNSILALSQLMMSRGVGRDPAKEVEYLGVIERNGRRLLNLINDILDLSKIESGRMEIELANLAPAQVAAEAIETVRPLATEKGLKLTLDLHPCPQIQSDVGKTQQILINLLSNGIKFTESGEVHLKASSDESEILFEVTDSGIGIAEDQLLHIFDEFRQVDGSTTRRHEGTGLGLAICRKLSRMLGGDIEVTSTVSAGSTFVLRLPIAEPTGAKMAIGQTPGLEVDRYFVPDSPPMALSDDESRPLVLVVDDEESVRQLICDYLIGGGYRVATASNGRQALRLARELKPFAITLDVVMPEIDGWEVLRELKASPDTKEIPVFVVSISNDRDTGVALGASGYVLKPVDKTALLNEITRVQNVQPVEQLLIVDDDVSFSEATKEFLVDSGFQVRTLSSSPLAKEEVKRQRTDLVVLDLMMPEVDGFEVLESLREDPETADLPVIILTAKDLTLKEKERLLSASERIITKGSTDKKELLEEVLTSLGKLRAPTPPEAAKTILIVEDNEVAVIQISTALEDLGHNVLVAKNGAEGLETLEHTVPDAIVLDLMMPGVDGFEVLESLRSTPETLETPVLVLTAKELTSEDRAKLSRNNISQLIKKGEINRSQLVKCIQKLLAPKTAEAPEPTPKAVSGGKAVGKKILAVEDNDDNIITLGAIFDDLGVEYAFARDGQEGVNMASEYAPALIFMDIQLPDMSGIEATHILRKDPATANIPIIALTAKAMIGDRASLLGEGMSDYLAKPFGPKDIGLLIKKWLG
jgi:CheY-like chemotaxis protein/GAF domain-containing protein